MSGEAHEGWKNYETWCVNLWLTNDESEYAYWRGVTSGLKYEYPDGVTKQAKYDLADRLKIEIGEGAPELKGVWADLLSAALSEVDWYEIAEGFLDT